MKRCGPSFSAFKPFTKFTPFTSGYDTLEKKIAESYMIPAELMGSGNGSSSLAYGFTEHMAKAQADLAYQIEKHLFGDPSKVLKKSGVFDEDDDLTDEGFAAMASYADTWLAGERDLALERKYPELSGNFYDVRSDPDTCSRFSSPHVILVKSKLPPELVAKVKAHWDASVAGFSGAWKTPQFFIKDVP